MQGYLFPQVFNKILICTFKPINKIPKDCTEDGAFSLPSCDHGMLKTPKWLLILWPWGLIGVLVLAVLCWEFTRWRGFPGGGGSTHWPQPWQEGKKLSHCCPLSSFTYSPWTWLSSFLFLVLAPLIRGASSFLPVKNASPAYHRYQNHGRLLWSSHVIPW